MTTNSSSGTPAAGRPGVARVATHDQSGLWARTGPLAPEVRRHLAEGFGAKVKALRAERGMTQVKLAELLRCDARTVRRLEVGQHRPTRQQVGWIAAALSPEGQQPQVLDHALCDLVGPNMRPRTKKLRRRELLSSLYTLPAERTTQHAARLKEVRRQIGGRYRTS
ncbi:helix-turn-helix domain-containing protein [Lentzea chajnantorensis]